MTSAASLSDASGVFEYIASRLLLFSPLAFSTAIAFPGTVKL
jgi:hypothetical protein